MVHLEPEELEAAQWEGEGDESAEDPVELSPQALADILGKQNVENVDASQISHLNLDRQRIGRIPDAVLSDFKAVTNLYLQHNSIDSLRFCSQVRLVSAFFFLAPSPC